MTAPRIAPVSSRVSSFVTAAIILGVGGTAYAQTFPHRAPPPAPKTQTMAALNPPVPEEGGARYHVGASLLCSDCHTMHFSMQHGWTGATPIGTTPVLDGDWLGAAGPNAYLLKTTSSVELCLSCHDGKSFAPDVVGADANALAERSAGYFAELNADNYRGHKLATNLSSDPNDYCSRCHFGGTMGSAAVQCIDCHARHGNGHFRNLQWVSAPGSEPEIRAYTLPGATGMQRYEAANVRYPTPTGSEYREVTNICIDCHHGFMDGWTYTTNDPWGSGSPFIRHPGTNSEWGAYRPIDAAGANTDPANWVSATVGFEVPRLKFAVRGAANFADAGVVAPNNEVFCLTCHKAHGSEYAFGLRWDMADPAQTRKGCDQCHKGAVD